MKSLLLESVDDPTVSSNGRSRGGGSQQRRKISHQVRDYLDDSGTSRTGDRGLGLPDVSARTMMPLHQASTFDAGTGARIPCSTASFISLALRLPKVSEASPIGRMRRSTSDDVTPAVFQVPPSVKKL